MSNSSSACGTKAQLLKVNKKLKIKKLRNLKFKVNKKLKFKKLRNLKFKVNKKLKIKKLKIQG